jgi:hypothetical protein
MTFGGNGNKKEGEIFKEYGRLVENLNKVQ